MGLVFYSYPKCGTCRTAKKWLEANKVAFEEIHIVDRPPSKEEIKTLYENSEQELKKFLNTSGQKYRQLGMKELIKTASDEEIISMLAEDGMLLKRPIVSDGKTVTLGFKEEIFENTWK